MRKKFNLDVKTLESVLMLLHGPPGGGKTHLLGDMLRTEKEKGEVAYIDVGKEMGSLTIANFQLGNIAETVETLEDLKEVLAEYTRPGKFAGVGVDGLQRLTQLIIKKVCGDNLPVISKTSQDWQKIHREFDTIFSSLRDIAPIVVCTAASDKSMDQLTGETSLTPDFPGRQAAGSAYYFDFVFMLRSEAIGPNRIKRTVYAAPIANTVIRARLPKSLPATIELPEGNGGWAVVKSKIEKCLE